MLEYLRENQKVQLFNILHQLSKERESFALDLFLPMNI